MAITNPKDCYQCLSPIAETPVHFSVPHLPAPEAHNGNSTTSLHPVHLQPSPMYVANALTDGFPSFCDSKVCVMAFTLEHGLLL